MATPSPEHDPRIDAAFEQIRTVGEQLLSGARQVGTQYVAFLEKSTDRAIDFERTLAGSTRQEWLKALIGAHADLAHDLSASYTGAIRGLLK